MAYTKIDYDIVNGRAEVVINRPDLMNAFDEETLLELNEALQSAMTNNSVYAVILSGRGKGFCSGADVTSMDGREDREEKHLYGSHLWLVQNVNRLLYFGQKPTIAAVNGPAVGAGCDFALACDLRIMNEETFLRQQFINIGLVPGDGGGWLLPRLVGESKAKELILTGRDIEAAEAVDLGLAVEAVSDGETMDRARKLANELRDKPAIAMQNTKQLIDLNHSFEDYTQAALEAQWDCVNDPEHTEAVNAVIEGRDPEFDREY
ncbi:enoyl-CoA hydratase/isomerase family protein [Halostagnicola kamekurae]|uniref:Enoyl-CoA hydratase/carnithine racemase n=1 Tax=Halostagnicola kamekurae TaxID=619731 RepID=A0A1I6UPB8_9EURY|nr:enoyl-CoA hydratase/isomerase family protein [Halostagnicola kamekurae]SFT03312.1 Enoyl-CoA hydratase/carnithine racemase [Halostagnicola kamekurae]